MPNEQDHLRLAEKNKQVVVFLCQRIDQFSDWVTCVAFYQALHLVEAVLARDKIHGRDHSTRQKILQQTPRYKKIAQHYRPLYMASLAARYLHDPREDTEYSTFFDCMTPEQVKQDILGHHLKQIEHSVEKLLQ